MILVSGVNCQYFEGTSVAGARFFGDGLSLLIETFGGSAHCSGKGHLAQSYPPAEGYKIKLLLHGHLSYCYYS